MDHLELQSAFVGTFIDTPAPGEIRIRRDHVLAVDAEGRIAHLDHIDSAASQRIVAHLTSHTNTDSDLGSSSSSSSSSSKSSRDPSRIVHLPVGSFLLPTFTDLHLHAPQYLYAGTGLDLPLMEWLDKYAYRAEERIDADPKGLAATVYRRLAQRLVEGGTGCVVCFGTIGVEANLVLAEELARAGIRAFVGKLSMDQSPRPTYGEVSAEASFQTVHAFLDGMSDLNASLPAWNQGLVRPILTPRFVPTCSDKLLRGLATIAKDRGVWVQSHMCESRDQMAWVESTRGKKDEVVFDEAGLLGETTVQAHVTSLPTDLISLVKARGVTLAHCPLSNAYFSDAKFPLREAIDADLKVGLGSDIAGGYALSMQTAMRQAVVTARHREGDRRERTLAAKAACSETCTHQDLPSPSSNRDLRVDWRESLYLATRGGKKALGMGGCFEVGMEMDAQLKLMSPEAATGVGQLDLFDTFGPTGPSDPWLLESLERWWCNGDDRNRRAMYINGRRV